jgi:tetratricopeptide (TPR) repeat protein
VFKAERRWDEAAPLLESAASGLRRALGPDNPEGLIAAGFLVGVRLEQGRHAGLEPVLLELVEKLPRLVGDRNIESVAARYNLGCYYALTGQRERALRFLREAIDRGFIGGGFGFDADPNLASLHQDPQFRELVTLERWNVDALWQAAANEAAIHVSRGHIEEAERIYLGIIGGADRTAQPRNEIAMTSRVSLADLYLKSRRYSDVEEITRSWPPDASQDGDWFRYPCELHRGDKAKALATIARLRDLQPESTADFAYTKAVYHAVLGEDEAALRWLALAADRKLQYGSWPTYDIAFEPYRDDPRFRSLMARFLDEKQSSRP